MLTSEGSALSQALLPWSSDWSWEEHTKLFWKTFIQLWWWQTQILILQCKCTHLFCNVIAMQFYFCNEIIKTTHEIFTLTFVKDFFFFLCLEICVSSLIFNNHTYTLINIQRYSEWVKAGQVTPLHFKHQPCCSFCWNKT